MEEIVTICIVASCILAPIGLAVYVGAVYSLGLGSVKIPGISRGPMREGKHWSSVSVFSRKTGEALGAVVSAAGAVFGLLGFLLPWVELNIGGGVGGLNLGALNGTLTGIAFVVQSFIVGIGLLSVDVEGATTIGFLLTLISVFVAVIPVALLVLVWIAARMVAGPLGLIKANLARLSRPLFLVSLLALGATCGFFALVQATVGGLQVGASEGLFGSALSMGIGVSQGFWVTTGGLVLAIVGAISARTLAPRLEDWSSRLATLEPEVGEDDL